MRKIILTFAAAALIAGSVSSVAFAREHLPNANAYAAPDSAASGYSGATDGWESTRGAVGGTYQNNDTNVYRDGQPRDDINPHGG